MLCVAVRRALLSIFSMVTSNPIKFKKTGCCNMRLQNFSSREVSAEHSQVTLSKFESCCLLSRHARVHRFLSVSVANDKTSCRKKCLVCSIYCGPTLNSSIVVCCGGIWFITLWHMSVCKLYIYIHILIRSNYLLGSIAWL